MPTRVYAFLTLIAAMVLSGCNSCNSPPPPVRQTTQTTTQTTVQAKKSLLHADDFDLQRVTSLITNGSGFKDMAALEKQINDPSTGINNVDIDHDGTTDYVSAKESDGGVIEFEAHPSSSADAEPVVVGTVNISQNTQTNTVTVASNYPSYVGGADPNGYYQAYPRSHFADTMFLYWMLRPHPYYAPVYRGYPVGYMSRPVYTPQVMQQTRTQYQTTTKVAPIPRATSQTAAPLKSPSVKPDTAQRVESKYGPPPQGAGSLKGNAAGQKDYTVRNPDKPKPTGNGSLGGPSTAAPTTKVSPPSPPPASPRAAPPRAAPPSPPPASPRAAPPPPRAAPPSPPPPRPASPPSRPSSPSPSRGGRR